MKKFIHIFIGIVFAFFIAFLFYMIFIVKAGPADTRKENSVEVSGIVSKVYEGGVKDLVFKLENDTNIYYINRALENGFDLKTIEKELLGKKVELWYAKHRSSPNGGGHMTQIKFNDSLYYTEWQIPLASVN